MTIEEIKKLWKNENRNAEAATELWDSKSEHFISRKSPTADESLAMTIADRYKLIKEGDSVLDIGCGGGRFAFAMEQRGAKNVLGIDLSPKMIDGCRANALELGSKAKFEVIDWDETDITNKGWKNNFDFVLANMTPAISSAESLIKMTECSLRDCLMVKPTRNTNSVMDELIVLLDMYSENKKHDETVLYAFELLWRLGYKPWVNYEERNYDSEIDAEKLSNECILRLSIQKELTDAEKAAVRDFISKKADENGNVVQQMHFSVAALWWSVQ